MSESSQKISRTGKREYKMRNHISAEIISVGTELLLGDITNTNTAYLARRLAELGIPLYRQTVVGDNAARLTQALQEAYSRSRLVILTGGLGPTCDDITKETVAAYFSLPMEEDTPTKEAIVSYFHTKGRSFTENNLKQCLVPVGATVFTNSWGTAPGIGIEQDGKYAVLLPGPPHELKLMFEETVLPWLSRLSSDTLYSLNLHLTGIGEGEAEAVLREMMDAGENPTIAPYAGEDDVRIRITARAENEAQAKEMCAAAAEKIRETAVGKYIFASTDTPEAAAAVVERTLLSVFFKKGLTFGAAESCTGGMVCQRITALPGASSVLQGGIVSYANEVKTGVLGVSRDILHTHGAVSEPCAAQMARGAAAQLGCDIAVAVTGIAGPDGGTAEKPVGTVCFAVVCGAALGGKVRTCTEHYRSGLTRERIRRLASGKAMQLAIAAAKEAGDRQV
jgi:nicotinamide-nucleotide amidase